MSATGEPVRQSLLEKRGLSRLHRPLTVTKPSGRNRKNVLFMHMSMCLCRKMLLFRHTFHIKSNLKLNYIQEYDFSVFNGNPFFEVDFADQGGRGHGEGAPVSKV